MIPSFETLLSSNPASSGGGLGVRNFNEILAPLANRIAVDTGAEDPFVEQANQETSDNLSFVDALNAQPPEQLQQEEVQPMMPEPLMPVDALNNAPSSSERVSPKELSVYISDRITKSKLNGFVPKDGAKYGIKTGSPSEWSRFFTGLAKVESGFKNGTVGDVGKFEGNSNGLFQLSPQDATNHRLKNSKFTLDELRNPQTNTDAAIAIAERLMLQDGVIAANKKGAARYWGPLRRGVNPSNQKF